MSRLPIQEIKQRYKELEEKLTKTTETSEIIKFSKEQKILGKQNDLATLIENLEKTISQNKNLLETLSKDDSEMIELTNLDIVEKTDLLLQAENELLSFLSPRDPRDDSDIYLEIRAGAGGDESSLFASDLVRMYSYLCQRLGFTYKIISSSENDLGGFKEVIIEVRGEGAFSWFKYERGVHRVQRVPSTEKQGRIHTSTVAVAVMPIIARDNDFKLDPKDIEIIVGTSQGKGGQSVNTTYSAVRMKHIPTGMEAQSQDERNQLQNKEKALQVLTSRVFDYYEEIRLEKESAERKEQVGRMDRSEKIRTYNYPQDRLTDHRFNQNWNQLPSILNGDIEKVILDCKRLEAENILSNL